MRTGAWLALWVAAGCGRVDFDPAGSGATNTWGIVQVGDVATMNGKPSLTATLAPTKAGDLLVVACHVDAGDTVTSVVDDAPGGSSAYTRIAMSRANNQTTNDGIEFWYAASAADAQAVTMSSNQNAFTLVVWEIETARPATVDTASVASNEASSTLPVSPTITTKNADELVLVSAVSESTIRQIHAGNDFTEDSTANVNGFAHLADPHAPAGSYQAVWDADTGRYCANAAAFVVAP